MKTDTHTAATTRAMTRNVALYPWLRFCISLMFWQAIWFLYFQESLSAAEALLLFVVSDLTSTLLEVPSGWFSDRFGRRRTLIVAGLTGTLSGFCLGLGDSFAIFAIGQALMGASMAFVSGTDSAILYESLARLGREKEVEAQEVRGMRFTFAAMALSAVLGGILAVQDGALPYLAYAIAMGAAFAIALMLKDAEQPGGVSSGGLHLQWVHLKAAFAHPVLRWLLCLSLLLYAYSHIPFVFGQPYIAEVLNAQNIEIAPEIISGLVAAVMTVLPFATALIAPALRRALGLAPLLLTAFGIHLLIAGLLSFSNAPWVIAFLFLRRVPDSLSKPFIVARAQPLLASDSRATYFSLVSLFGRLLLSVSLLLASGSVSGAGEMAYADMQQVLWWMCGLGLVCLGVLASTAKSIAPEKS